MSRAGLRAVICGLALAIGCGTGVRQCWARGAPALTLPDLSGRPQNLSALKGSVVVLSFWATWCGPCLEELPRLSKLRESYRDRQVTFIAVSIDEAKDRSRIKPYLEKANVQLETWTGADTDTMARFGLGDIVPSTIILDERGNIVVRIQGEAQDEDVRAPVNWLLAGRNGPPPPARVKRY